MDSKLSTIPVLGSFEYFKKYKSQRKCRFASTYHSMEVKNKNLMLVANQMLSAVSPFLHDYIKGLNLGVVS